MAEKREERREKRKGISFGNNYNDPRSGYCNSSLFTLISSLQAKLAFFGYPRISTG